MLRPQDIRIETYRSAAAKSYNAVKITHLPTGTVSSCDEHKSTFENKRVALRDLTFKLRKIDENY